MDLKRAISIRQINLGAHGQTQRADEKFNVPLKRRKKLWAPGIPPYQIHMTFTIIKVLYPFLLKLTRITSVIFALHSWEIILLPRICISSQNQNFCNHGEIFSHCGKTKRRKLFYSQFIATLTIWFMKARENLCEMMSAKNMKEDVKNFLHVISERKNFSSSRAERRENLIKSVLFCSTRTLMKTSSLTFTHILSPQNTHFSLACALRLAQMWAYICTKPRKEEKNLGEYMEVFCSRSAMCVTLIHKLEFYF